MKRILLSGVAIAACFALATTASAQYGSNYQYSSYGYSHQQQPQQPAASPSDAPVPVPAAPTAPGTVAGPAPSVNAGGCDSGCCGVGGCGVGSVLGGCDNGCYGGAGGCGNGCSGGLGCGCGLGMGSADRNIVVGVRALWFERDYEDDRPLGSNALSDYWFSTNADHDNFGGFETTIGVRNCSGSGWEVGYWGLFPDEADVTFFNPAFTSSLTGLGAVTIGGGTALDAFNNADNWRLYRDTEVHNLELNLLRNGGCTCGIFGGSANIEWLAGFRWFRFEETLRLTANGAAAPLQTNYYSDTENDLMGFQLGARIERCLNNCWSLSFGTKFGVYNNDIYARQSIADENGAWGTVAGNPYTYSANKDDVATLGELDLGLNYQFNACTRANFGYRVVGVSGIALAADQIPYDFTNAAEITRVKSNGSLLLHGLYFGLERSF